MSVAGKKHEDWVAQTFCDFGTPGRREVISNHFFIETANRGFARIRKIYSRQGWHCWQEDRDGTVINGDAPDRCLTGVQIQSHSTTTTQK